MQTYPTKRSVFVTPIKTDSEAKFSCEEAYLSSHVMPCHYLKIARRDSHRHSLAASIGKCSATEIKNEDKSHRYNVDSLCVPEQ